MATILNFTGKIAPGQVGASISIGLPGPTPTPTPLPTLNALTLSNVTGGTVGQAFSATIVGKTTGSAIITNIAGLSVSGTSITGTPTAAGSLALTETLAGYANSPRTTLGLATIVDSAASGLTAANLWTNPQGRAWYNGPAVFMNLSMQGGTQWNGSQEPGGTPSTTDLPESAFSADGTTIAACPPGGALHTPHPPNNVGNGRLRTTIYGTANIVGAFNMRASTSAAQGVNPDGSKWIEYSIQAGWNGDYATVRADDIATRVLVGTNGGSVTNIITAFASEYDANGLVPAGRLNRYRPEAIAEAAGNYGGWRYLDWLGTNSNTGFAITAANRPQTGNIFNKLGGGFSFEECVDFSNVVGFSGAYNLPWDCDRTYVFAFLDYAHANHAAGTHIKVEAGNEVWNNIFKVFYAALAYAEARPKPGAGRNWNESDGVERLIWAHAQVSNQLMTWVAEWGSERGVSVGEYGRVRRVLAWQNANPNLCANLMDQCAGKFDVFADGPYFGLNANTEPTPTNDIEVTHQRMRADIDVVWTHGRQNADKARTLGAGYTTYEANSHNPTSSIPGGSYDEFQKQRQIDIHQSPLMFNTFSYHVGEGFRRIPWMQEYNLFAHAGPVSLQGYFSLKDRLDSTEAQSQRLRAWNRLKQGITDYPGLGLSNAPAPAQVGSSTGYTPQVVGGAGFGVPKTISFSNWRLDGTPTTPSALGVTVATASWTAAFAQAGTVTFDVNISDSGGNAVVSRSVTVTAAEVFNFTEDATAVTTPAEPLSGRGWLNAASSSRRDGFVYTTESDRINAATALSHAMGASGADRRIIVDLVSRGDNEVMWIDLFTGGLGLFLNFATKGILLNNGHDFFAGVGGNLIPATGTPFSVELRQIGTSAEVFVNDVSVGSGFNVPAGDASAGIAIGWQAHMTNLPLFRRLRAKVL